MLRHVGDSIGQAATVRARFPEIMLSYFAQTIRLGSWSPTDFPLTHSKVSDVPLVLRLDGVQG